MKAKMTDPLKNFEHRFIGDQFFVISAFYVLFMVLLKFLSFFFQNDVVFKVLSFSYSILYFGVLIFLVKRGEFSFLERQVKNFPILSLLRGIGLLSFLFIWLFAIQSIVESFGKKEAFLNYYVLFGFLSVFIGTLTSVIFLILRFVFRSFRGNTPENSENEELLDLKRNIEFDKEDRLMAKLFLWIFISPVGGLFYMVSDFLLTVGTQTKMMRVSWSRLVLVGGIFVSGCFLCAVINFAPALVKVIFISILFIWYLLTTVTLLVGRKTPLLVKCRDLFPKVMTCFQMIGALFYLVFMSFMILSFFNFLFPIVQQNAVLTAILFIEPVVCLMIISLILAFLRIFVQKRNLF